MLIYLIHHLPAWVAAFHASPDLWQSAFHVHVDLSLLAQQFDTDVFSGARNAFNNFVESGQVWALLVGLILGYLIRGFTTYG